MDPGKICAVSDLLPSGSVRESSPKPNRPTPRFFLVWVVGLVTFANGLATVFSLMKPDRVMALQDYSPITFPHLSPFLTLIVGFALAISSINVIKGKRRAFFVVSALALISTFFHILEGPAYVETGLSFLLFFLLIISRRHFRVKSSTPDLKWASVRFGAALFLAVAYGIAGFWLLDPHQFGKNFHLGEAVRLTFLALTFSESAAFTPQTRYALWLLDSLHLIGVVGVGYALFAVFRPVRYRFVTLPRERELARKILEVYGRHAMDFFKIWPDKSLFFSSTQRTFLAYRVSANFSVVLADPVGPEEEIEAIVSEFIRFCEENAWRMAFHQTLPDFLPVYEKLGFRKFKIGDDAVVDLALFSLDGERGRRFRRVVSRIVSQGIRIRQITPPLSADDLEELEEVSDEWLAITGKRERGFTLGAFNREYIGTTTILEAVAPGNRVLGFVNLVPSYRKGEMTSDLMRRRNDVPNGLMDYIFIELFLYLKQRGYERFNMGMAPMSGFREEEDATAEERAIHYFFQHTRFLFSFKGLKAYKAKFATSWEPRYVVYQNALDLARHARAIYGVSERATRGKRFFL
jgi:phosphatidylglycerol lysyltransferase